MIFSTPPPKARRQTKKAQATRVHTLAAAGEEGRALAATSAETPAPRTQETYDQLGDLFLKTSTTHPTAPTTPLQQDPAFQREVAQEVQKLLNRPAKLTAPGLFGTRLEHLAACAADPRALELLAWAASLLATGDAPASVFTALRRGEVVGLAKKDGGVKPLVIGACLRRLALRAVVRVRKEALCALAGAHQYGVGRPAGADRVARALRVLAKLRPDAVFIKLDLKAAFQLIRRGLAMGATAAALPELTNTLLAWYGSPSQHWWRTATGEFLEINSLEGFDQGCPLAAALFSAGLNAALLPFWDKARQHDTHMRLYAYLDDMYVVCSRDASLAILCELEGALTETGLVLNGSKTQLWCPGGLHGIPPTLPGKRVTSLEVLGAALKTHGDDQEAPVAAAGTGVALDKATGRLRDLWNRLAELQKAGLTKQAAAALLRTYAGSSSQHALRLERATDGQTKTYDQQLLRCWADLLERPLTDDSLPRLGLPLKLGGMGAQLATTRRDAAPWSSWAATLAGVAHDLGYEVLQDLLDQLPLLTAELNTLRSSLNAEGTRVPPEAPLGAALKTAGKQSQLVADIQRKTWKSLLASMGDDGAKATFRIAAGPGAGAFLLYPVCGECELEAPLWATSARRRLGLPHPAASEQELHRVSTTCCNVGRNGQRCGANLDASGRHSADCRPGGGVLKRHAGLEKAVAGLARRWHDVEPQLEQHLPELDQQNADGTTRRAVMDVVVPFIGGRQLIDVTVRQGDAGTRTAVRAAAAKDGVPSSRAEQEKHARYPVPELVAFAAEGCGRLGGEARSWLRIGASRQPADLQVRELTRAHRVISAVVQGQTARALRASAGLT